MRLLPVVIVLSGHLSVAGQPFTESDSLRGSITPERAWWDLLHYHLEVEVLPEEKSIIGRNTIRYQVLKPHHIMQVDLQQPLNITTIEQNGVELDFSSRGNAHFIDLVERQEKGSIKEITISYMGKPREAVRAPWDGGFTWERDTNGNHFIATSCQGLGASVWWPNKDHMYDEPDSIRMSVEVPQNLVDVSNGRLVKVEKNKKKKTKTYHWVVSNPINNYGVNLNIGNYISWSEQYPGEKGPLDVTYWALEEDLQKAEKQFKQVPMVLEALEYWLGPYPFYEDGYQLVQVPYLGMEHQSSVTYGNGFENGYMGRDLSTTGWGMKFDFVIVHESAHEWFANNLTHRDIADMWLHESFTCYAESLFLEYFYGKEAGQAYVRGIRANIENRKPMIGPYGVNYRGFPIDVYYKGSNMLNTLRTIVNNDGRWKRMLRALGERFYHQTTRTEEVEAFISDFLEMDLRSFFDQYLRDPRVPTLEYYFAKGLLHYRWINAIPAFSMPVTGKVGKTRIGITPTGDWQTMKIEEGTLNLDPNYYIGTLKSR